MSWRKRGFLVVQGLFRGVFHSTEDIGHFFSYILDRPNLWARLDMLDGKTLLCSCRSNGLCHARGLALLAAMKKDGIERSADLLFQLRETYQFDRCDDSRASVACCDRKRKRKQVSTCYSLPFVAGVKPVALQPSIIVDSRIVGDSDPQILLHSKQSSSRGLGTGIKRKTSSTDGSIGASGRLVCSLKPITQRGNVFVIGSSQLRTFTTCKVPCRENWYVVSLPGGRFQDCVTEIKDFLLNDSLDVTSLASIVLVIGTNDLSKGGPVAHWERDLQELLSLCLSRFHGLPILLVGPTPRLDESAVSDINRIMEKVCLNMDPTATRIRFADFGSSFPKSKTDLWARNDGIHLSCNAGLPLLRKLIEDKVNVKPRPLEEPAMLPWMWKSIERHAKGCHFLRCGHKRVRGVWLPIRRNSSPSSSRKSSASFCQKRIACDDVDDATRTAISRVPSTHRRYRRLTSSVAAFSHRERIDVGMNHISLLLPCDRLCITSKLSLIHISEPTRPY